jgi:hypothetical protein
LDAVARVSGYAHAEVLQDREQIGECGRRRVGPHQSQPHAFTRRVAGASRWGEDLQDWAGTRCLVLYRIDVLSPAAG